MGALRVPMPPRQVPAADWRPVLPAGGENEILISASITVT